MPAGTPDPCTLLIVCPTWACNLRCGYCYQDHADEWMSAATVAAVERFVARNAARVPYFWLEFFGGEPLLCADAVARLAGGAFRACEENGVRFGSGVTTNAVMLDRATFRRLYDAGVHSFQITLDGTPAFHDRHRVTAGGGGSWDRIWGNLLDVRASAARVQVLLRVHFRVDELDEAVRLVREHVNPAFGADPRFAVQFEEVRRLGGPNDASITVAPAAAVAAALRTLDAALARPGQLAGVGRQDYECYASKAQTLVVTPDGGLAKCTVSLAPLGRLRADGTVELDPARAAEHTFRAAKCVACPNSAPADSGGSAKLLPLPVLAGA